MSFSYILAFLFVIPCICLFFSPVPDGNVLLDGAQAAVKFVISVTGSICFGSAVMELAERAGAAGALARVLRRPLRRLFPRAAKEPEVMEALTENVTANLMGLGNAATPAGIRAAQGMQRLSPDGSATDELCLLAVINTASLQLIPTTVAAVRASCGAEAPFDILPAVWLCSLVSLAAGLGAAAVLRRVWR